MSDILLAVQNRIERLRDHEKEAAEHILCAAFRQIDLIDQVKNLQEELKEVRREISAHEKRLRAERMPDGPLSRKEVRALLKCGRTRVWELEQIDLLHSFPVSGRGRHFDPEEVRRVMAMDPVEVGLTIKQWDAKKKALGKHPLCERDTVP